MIPTPNKQTDQYFSTPTQVRDASGNVYDASNGTFEIVQNWDSLSGITNFRGSLDNEIKCSSQLQYRRLYIGLAIDDWLSYEFIGRVELLLNDGFVASIPISKSFNPPEQTGSNDFGAPVLIPCTALDRTLITGNNQFTVEVPHEPCPFIQNELISTISYSAPEADPSVTPNVYEYWVRITPFHMHCMFNKARMIVDRWRGFPNVTGGLNHDGLATLFLACASQRYS